VGTKITLTKLGEVSVKELTLEQIVECALELATLASTFDLSQKDDPSAILRVILRDPATLKAVQVFAAAATGRKPSDYENMGVSDWLTVIVAIKAVTDWEKMQQLFTELGVVTLFKDRMKQKKTT
jgi:hypothetical protein